jgi:hypothetical protein
MGFDKSEYSEGERLRQIPGFEGLYVCSNYGKVQRLTSGNNTFAGKVLKPIINRKTGYPYVKLTKQGKVHKKQLHILVAQLFLPEPKEEGLIVNHIDGNKENPKVTNLEWITRSENTKHAIRTGLQKLCYGKDNGATKINFSKISELRADYETGNFTQKELAEKYNLSLVYVSNIINKKFRADK